MKLMTFLVYQLYARWNYLKKCTGYDMFFYKSSEQTTWLINYFMTPPYEYAQHRLRKPPDGCISGTVVFSINHISNDNLFLLEKSDLIR